MSNRVEVLMIIFTDILFIFSLKSGIVFSLRVLAGWMDSQSSCQPREETFL